MNRNKFAGPAILAGFAILIWQGVSLLANIMYDDGDTINPILNLAFLGMGLISILMCLSSLVWFAFALGTKTQQKVLLAENLVIPKITQILLLVIHKVW